MISFPNAKINIGLNIVAKRADGFHNLQSVFYPVPLRDVLEVVVDTVASKGEISMRTTGLAITGDVEKNLCTRAYRMLHELYDLPAVKVHLHKVIPMGAGLGGGSADGAFMLTLLNDLFELSVPEEKLFELADKLGSDCPFFVRNTPSYVTGKGMIAKEVEADLSNYHLVLINPGIHVSTVDAFSAILQGSPPANVLEEIEKPVSEWQNKISNDFEKSVFKAHPQLAEIKQKLYGLGADYVSMTGTGSTIYGLFKENPDLSDFSKEWFVWSEEIR